MRFSTDYKKMKNTQSGDFTISYFRIFAFFFLTLSLLAGCQTTGSNRGRYQSQPKPQPLVENTQFTTARQETRINTLESSVANLRNEIDDINGSLNRTSANAEKSARDANADTRAEIAALRKELSDLRRRVDAMPGTISALIDEREKGIIAYVDKAIKASEARRPAQTSSSGGGAAAGGSYSGAAWKHTVAQGETLSEIAQAYTEAGGKRITAAEIMSANNIKDASKLKVGQVVLVPKK